ncbi:GAF and ANTAR domain-containing protein [Intrasporangium sp. YIM S08009]|uniref:GAF and ANTAR domain-containing protein n=1 Tax=Intrasporangium zincisolvens TaxID=3080018 RepID=UPI002B055981|nr:GAF and ANTAR domain-containing protein [Intrasporangium sp. YIM S08009]
MTSQTEPAPRSAPVNPEALAARLSVLGTADGDALLQSSLRSIAAACDDLLVVDGTGIMLADESGELRYVVATDDAGRRLEHAQLQTAEGPCIDAYVRRVPVTARDVAGDGRWPWLAEALSDSGIRGVLGVPIQLDGAPVGTLNVYRKAPIVWGDDLVGALTRFADVAEQLMRAAVAAERAGELAAQLTYAIEHRAPIERAVGFLMARAGVAQADAFELLRSTARSSRRRIGDVADEVLASGDRTMPAVAAPLRAPARPRPPGSAGRR